MVGDKKNFWTAVSILIGTCIGAGVLGIPYIASQSGFFVTLAYILGIGVIILFLNLYLGEIALRTKGDHQLVGYAEKYLGKKGKHLMEFSIVFGVYAAIVAYALGIGESLSFLFFENSNYTTLFGIGFGVLMSVLFWRGRNSLKNFEKIGVAIILFLLLFIFFNFINKIDYSNLTYFNPENIFLPFGVVVFALLAFHSIPELKIILNKNKIAMKKALIIGTLTCILFYILFAFLILGYKGISTPEVATIALGGIFILLGIFTMFTSWLSLGTALEESYILDEKILKKKSWVFVSVIPLLIFLAVQFSDFFSFTIILSIGGVVSGGLAAILILLMVRKAKDGGNRKPEYSVPINWFVAAFFILIFLAGIVREVFLALR